MASDRVRDAIDQVDKTMSIAGVPGVSIGIMKRGQALETYHKGFRDVKQGLAPDNDTRYNINSLTKAFISALAGIEIYEGRKGLDWSKPVKAFLPDFSGSTSDIESESTIIDLLSHRWGASGFDDFWFGCDNVIFLPRDEVLRSARVLRPAEPFRAAFE